MKCMKGGMAERVVIVKCSVVEWVKLKMNTLRWFEHMKRMSEESYSDRAM